MNKFVKLSRPFCGVSGFLSAKDRETLEYLSRYCNVAAGDFVEVGSYEGLSALHMLSEMSDKKQLVCYDHFECEKMVSFYRNILMAGGFGGRVSAVRGNFNETAAKDEFAIAFAFIDHSHTLKDTVSAYEIFWPRISPGGVMAFHDYSHPEYQEPREFLDSLKHVRICENSILAFKK